MPEQRKKSGVILPGIEHQVRTARRHADFQENLAQAVLHQHAGAARVQATRESRKLYNLCSQVQAEHMRLTCYLRLAINPHGILHASHTPRHRIEDLLVRHFLYRFPRYTIVLASARGTFIGWDRQIARSDQPLETVLARLEQSQPVDPLLQELKATDDGIWEAFYRSQYVKEKENPQLFRRNVPREFLKTDAFAVERKLGRRAKGLESFFWKREVQE
ncbi:MAG: DUF4130 domain-containing protein [Candidatus Aenigmarchaeota archaeon]|nr:DUF4130 domain-containing protein [Candidatus Aenigmarchaeota archaeon]